MDDETRFFLIGVLAFSVINLVIFGTVAAIIAARAKKKGFPWVKYFIVSLFLGALGWLISYFFWKTDAQTLAAQGSPGAEPAGTADKPEAPAVDAQAGASAQDIVAPAHETNSAPPAEGTPEVATPTTKAPQNKALIIGVAAGAAVLLLIVGSLSVFLIGLGGSSGSGSASRDCPELSDSFNTINSATYQVFAEFEGVDQTGQPVLQYAFIGTAWGVGERLLATNAHVAGVFPSYADGGVQLSRAVAVQAGTGAVVRLLRGALHPDYTGDPLSSPDVALFTTQEILPNYLPLAPRDSALELGDDFQLVGFPGDVDTFIPSTPGQTVPQATSLTGSITAQRSHLDTVVVTPDTIDYYQHQAPTTPGTSGSAIVHCGQVAAINNAGTVQIVVVGFDQEGRPQGDRVAAASNNFGVHVKHIHEMVELFQAQAIQGFELPVKVQAAAVIGDNTAENTQGESLAVAAGFVRGSSGGRLDHDVEFYIVMETGEIFGESDWGGGLIFSLAGRVNLQTAEFSMTDNAKQVNSDFSTGIYSGYFFDAGGGDLQFEGSYTEEGLGEYVEFYGKWAPP